MFNNIKDNLVVRGAAAVIASIALAYWFGLFGPNLKDAANDYADQSYCYVADDGSYIALDTNPFNFEGHTADGSIEAVQDINSNLGLPDYVYQRMIGTRAIDGTQMYEQDNISVSWTYHPDTGLEILYSVE